MQYLDAIRNEKTKSVFNKKGFVKIENIAKEYIEEAEKLYHKYLLTEKNEFNYSLMQLSAEKNIELHSLLSNIFNQLLQQLFQNYKFLSSSYLIKPAGYNKEMCLHQDWTFTDEQNYNPITIWIPLSDVSVDNGALYFLPSSHRFFQNYRSNDYQTSRFSGLDVFAQKVEIVTVEKGDIILFHPASFHGSFSNLTDKDRIVVSATILPLDAPYIHVKKKNETTALIHYIDNNQFFFDLKKNRNRHSFHGNLVKEVAYSHNIIEKQDLLNLTEKECL